MLNLKLLSWSIFPTKFRSESLETPWKLIVSYVRIKLRVWISIASCQSTLFSPGKPSLLLRSYWVIDLWNVASWGDCGGFFSCPPTRFLSPVSSCILATHWVFVTLVHILGAPWTVNPILHKQTVMENCLQRLKHRPDHVIYSPSV